MLLASCAPPAAAPAAPPEKASICVVPMSGEPKTKLVFYGSGFVPGEKVRIFMDIGGEVTMVFGPPGAGGVAVANEFGAFKLKSRGGIPRSASVPPGVYTLEARGDKGSIATAPLETLEKK